MPTSFQFIFLFLIWKWKVKKVAQKNQSNSTLWNGSEWQKGEKKQKKRKERERGAELIWKRIYWQDTSRQLIALLEHHISYPAAAKQERERESICCYIKTVKNQIIRTAIMAFIFRIQSTLTLFNYWLNIQHSSTLPNQERISLSHPQMHWKGPNTNYLLFGKRLKFNLKHL